MLKKTITYTDYNGNEQTEDCYFHLNRTELMDIALDLPDGIVEESTDANEVTTHLVDKLGTKGLFEFIKNVVKKSYGIKSEDGRRFEKSETISLEFTQTPMFDEIMTEFTTDDVAASNFINAVIPAEFINKSLEKTTKPAPKAKSSTKTKK